MFNILFTFNLSQFLIYGVLWLLRFQTEPEDISAITWSLVNSPRKLILRENVSRLQERITLEGVFN